MAKKLKKCPHCGNKKGLEYLSSLDAARMAVDDEEYTNSTANGWFVICNYNKDGCGARSGWGIAKKDARKSWNKRS